MIKGRSVLAALIGGAVLYASGYLIFNTLFAGFYATNVGSATGVDRDIQIIWALALANLAYACLIVFAIGKRGGNLSIMSGALTGAVAGFLMWLCVDFVFYATTHIASLTRTVVDPMLEFVHGGLGGAAIAAVLKGRGAAGAGSA